MRGIHSSPWAVSMDHNHFMPTCFKASWDGPAAPVVSGSANLAGSLGIRRSFFASKVLPGFREAARPEASPAPQSGPGATQSLLVSVVPTRRSRAWLGHSSYRSGWVAIAQTVEHARMAVSAQPVTRLGSACQLSPES